MCSAGQTRGQVERGVASRECPGSYTQPSKSGLSGTGPVGTQAEAVEKGLRAVDPRK